MQPSSKIELDNAEPQNAKAISDYYREHLQSILSSSDLQLPHIIVVDDDDSLTASDSELDDSPETRSKFLNPALSHDHNLQTINSVGINTSSDVHFGTRAFYQGPVTIKQFVVGDEERSSRKNSDIGSLTKGSAADIATPSNNCASSSSVGERPHSESERQNSTDANVMKIDRFMRNARILMVLVVAICAAMVAIALAFAFCPCAGREADVEPSLVEEEEELKVITRAEWNALPARGKLKKLHLPVRRFIIAHSIDAMCTTKEACTKKVQQLQMNFMNVLNYSDIGYNFLVGGDGNVYEGRGWSNQGSFLLNQNEDSVGVAYLGGFNNKLPSKLQLDAGERLMSEGLRVHALRSDFKIYGACQLRGNRTSPGMELMRLIETWPRWAGDGENIVDSDCYKRSSD